MPGCSWTWTSLVFLRNTADCPLTLTFYSFIKIKLERPYRAQDSLMPLPNNLCHTLGLQAFGSRVRQVFVLIKNGRLSGQTALCPLKPKPLMMAKTSLTLLAVARAVRILAFLVTCIKFAERIGSKCFWHQKLRLRLSSLPEPSIQRIPRSPQTSKIVKLCCLTEPNLWA